MKNVIQKDDLGAKFGATVPKTASIKYKFQFVEVLIYYKKTSGTNYINY